MRKDRDTLQRDLGGVLARLFLLLLGAAAAWGQSGSLVLSSGTGAPGGVVALDLSLTSGTGSSPAGLQWTLSYSPSAVSAISVSPGQAATNAAKALACTGGAGSYTCLLTGMNANPLASGAVARVNLTLSGSAVSTPINVTKVLGASPSGSAVSLTGTGSTVNVAVPGAPPTVFIDAPLSGSVLSGTASVSGWAIDNASSVGTAIKSVQVKVDGAVVGNATYGLSRPDVCKAFPGRPGCPYVGYSYSLNISKLSSGSHTLTVSATDSDGTPYVGSASVTFVVADSPPSVFIDTPTAGTVATGNLTVAGWAIDNTTAPAGAIKSVQVQVDGKIVGNATYGISRPDVCNAFPGRAGCPYVGYTYQLNTSTLVAGPHQLKVLATDTDATPDVGSWSVSFQVAGPPSVFIDTPVTGASVSGIVPVAGWAIDNANSVGTAIAKVQVKVDGAVVGTAAYGGSRPDVCKVFPGRPGCPNVGYNYSLNTAGLSPGTHVISVAATDTDGTPNVGSASVTVNVSPSSAPPTVFIDAPLAGSVISGITKISGWAIDNATSVGTIISKVQVKVDGNLVGNATYGVYRPDVCQVFPGRPACPYVGYSYALNTASLRSGTHSITVSATNSDGTPEIGSQTVAVNVVPTPPAVYIDTPAPGAVLLPGVVTVAGWAIDNAAAPGTLISRVQIKVDGVVVGTATYGVSRPDVCNAYPGRPGCPNVGFTYSLNTSNWRSGTHLITATATDSDGTPDAGSWSTTVQMGGQSTTLIDLPGIGGEPALQGSGGREASSGIGTLRNGATWK